MEKKEFISVECHFSKIFLVEWPVASPATPITTINPMSSNRVAGDFFCHKKQEKKEEAKKYNFF